MNNRLRMLFVLPMIFATLAAVQAPAQAQESAKPGLLVLDLKAKGVPEDVARSLTDLLAIELNKLDKYEVITREEIASVLTVEEQKMLMGVDEDAQDGQDVIKQAGDKLNAPFIMKGSIGQVGATYVISLSLIRVQPEVKVERRTNQNLVGRSDELIGSLRSAVIAIALDEAGVEEDITQDLLSDLHIAEKPKTMFFHLRTGWEIPVGPTKDEDDFLYFRPSYFNVLAEAEYHVLPWMGVMVSTGFATSVSEKYEVQTKRQSLTRSGTYTDAGLELDPASQISVIDVAISEIDFTAMKVPVDFGIKFRPPKGKFLPYAFAGLGFSYHMYSFDDEHVALRNEITGPGVTEGCAPPYSQDMYSAGGNGVDPRKVCKTETNLGPDGDITFFAMDVMAGVGMDYLFTEHIGLSLEARYLMNYSFIERDSAGQSDLDAIFTNTSDPIVATMEDDAAGNQQGSATIIGDTVPVPKVHHGMMFNIGLLMYF